MRPLAGLLGELNSGLGLVLATVGATLLIVVLLVLFGLELLGLAAVVVLAVAAAILLLQS